MPACAEMGPRPVPPSGRRGGALRMVDSPNGRRVRNWGAAVESQPSRLFSEFEDSESRWRRRAVAAGLASSLLRLTASGAHVATTGIFGPQTAERRWHDEPMAAYAQSHPWDGVERDGGRVRPG